MTKLNLVLYFALFCGLSVNATSPPEPDPPIQKLFADLYPLLEEALTDYGTAHADFKLRLKRIVSGKSEVVNSLTNYDLIVELENGEKQVTEWSANVVQGAINALHEITLTMQGEEYVIRPIEITRLGGFSKLSDQTITELYPVLEKALADWGTTHSEFGLKLKSIESGESQVVAGTIYNLIIKVENADMVVSEWSANVVENLKGKIVEVKLTKPGVEQLLTFE